MEVVLKNYFGFSSLRPYQSDVIHQALSGRDCFVVMATGGGKSLCYQLPPLLCKKTAVVISPLLSLMQDQVMSLKHKGIRSEYLGSTQPDPNVANYAQNGLYDVLYLTPEKAVSLPARFWSNMLNSGMCLLAVDEAHCISEWDPTFRLEYKMLHQLRAHLPGIPFIALTATATERIRHDIKSSLDLRDPFIFVGTFDRPNLYYGVNLMKPGLSTEESIIEMLKEVPRMVSLRQSTIIYCTTIRHTEKVHEILTSMGVCTLIYHGQMETKDRELEHKSFVNDKVYVMVATIAFGMGIDKPDVRCVIHFGCPRSLEAYYQESGRCGRDGQSSTCILYYSRGDFGRADYYCTDKTEEQKEYILKAFTAAQQYCTIASCRRQNILNYFGEDCAETCGNCDNCTTNVCKEKDLSVEVSLLLGCVEVCGGRWGLNMPIDVLRGSNAKKIITNNYHESWYHGKGKSRESSWWKGLGALLLSNGFLKQTINGSYRFISISNQGQNFIRGYHFSPQPLILKVPKEMLSDDEESDSTDEESCSLPDCLCDNEILMYQRLIRLRKNIADENNNAAPYAICSDGVLRNIAKCRPSDAENLSLVDGVNWNLVKCYGELIVHCVQESAIQLNLSLDNMDVDDSCNIQCIDSEVEESEQMQSTDLFDLVTYANVDDVPKDSIDFFILDIISQHHGVSFDTIISLLPSVSADLVAQGLQDLVSSFLIYEKDGLYFPL